MNFNSKIRCAIGIEFNVLISEKDEKFSYSITYPNSQKVNKSENFDTVWDAALAALKIIDIRYIVSINDSNHFLSHLMKECGQNCREDCVKWIKSFDFGNYVGNILFVYQLMAKMIILYKLKRQFKTIFDKVKTFLE